MIFKLYRLSIDKKKTELKKSSKRIESIWIPIESNQRTRKDEN